MNKSYEVLINLRLNCRILGKATSSPRATHQLLSLGIRGASEQSRRGFVLRHREVLSSNKPVCPSAFNKVSMDLV